MKTAHGAHCAAPAFIGKRTLPATHRVPPRQKVLVGVQRPPARPSTFVRPDPDAVSQHNCITWTGCSQPPSNKLQAVPAKAMPLDTSSVTKINSTVMSFVLTCHHCAA